MDGGRPGARFSNDDTASSHDCDSAAAGQRSFLGFIGHLQRRVRPGGDTADDPVRSC